jgi:molybdopterin/thiamine biosynthesis adenylyltransferase
LSLKKVPDYRPVGSARRENDDIYLQTAGEKIRLEDIESIPYQSEYASRSEGIVDTTILSRKRVTLVGLGSVGSALAVYLAESSVGRFRLVDPDRLSAANVSRHACDIRHLGRLKTRAVKDLILARNPQVRVQTFEEDFLSLTFEARAERLAGSDLVIASTDSSSCQFQVNEVCLDQKLPSLYVGCYARAQAGEVVYVIPGLTPCFNCLLEFRAEARSEIISREQSLPYRDDDDTGFQGEPGLAIDIGYVTSVAAGFALSMLAPESERRTLLDPVRNLVMFHAGSQPEKKYAGLFTMPFDYVRARVKRKEPCEVCQSIYHSPISNRDEIHKEETENDTEGTQLG